MVSGESHLALETILNEGTHTNIGNATYGHKLHYRRALFLLTC